VDGPIAVQAFLYFSDEYMKKLRWQIFIVLLTLVIVGILLVRQQPSPVIILPQPASGGIYTEGMIGELGRLNPLYDMNNSVDREIDRLIFSGIFTFDSQGLPQPDLAESWGVSLDGKIYNVTIRPNAVWHDGQPVTSDDFLFTLDLIRNKDSSIPEDVRSMWEQVKVSALDNKTLRFELAEPFAPFLDYMTFGILPKHILGTLPIDQLINSDFNIHPIGSGPYKFDSLKIDHNQINGVALKIFPEFYGQKPYIEQVVFQFFSNPPDALDAYKQGEVNGISQVSLDILDEAVKEKNLNLYSSRLPKISLVLFNLKNSDVSFFQDKVLRQALMIGLNRQWIVDNLLKGQAIIADNPILPGNWANFDGIKKYGFDQAEAISMLKEAGYTLDPDGSGIRVKDKVPLKFTLVYPDDELHASIARSVQNDWLNLGVNVELQAVSYDSLLNDYLSPRNFQAALIDQDFSFSHDPDPYPFWHQSEATGGQNYSQWDNRVASEYIEQARVIVDTSYRTKLYRNFQILFAKELPALPLYYPVFTFGVDSQVSGVQIPPLSETSDRFIGIKYWYLITKHSIGNIPTETGQP
jgi:peptide/nickel transport system substrate-binding protein